MPERSGGLPERSGGVKPRRESTARAEGRADAGRRAAPASLAELPFERHDPLVLLDLQARPDGTRRAEPNLDYAGFGWAELDALVLESDDGTREPLGPALVLALHTPDDPPHLDHLELALELPDPDADPDPHADPAPLVVLAPLDRFLAAWLPRLPRAAPHVVLALCNPGHLDPPRPSLLGPRQLHYAHGDVLAWLDVDPSCPELRPQIRLHAHAWHRR